MNLSKMQDNIQDCYYYYYSSCAKGSSCPFRHEPAALRNETMCIYWLQGNCTKPNCMFRHMKLHIQRDKIACFYETQPSGCKKVHCPYRHENIQECPTAEDVEKNPDIILPVKEVKEDKNEEEINRRVLYSDNTGKQKAIIVSLQDESDSESTSSPMKRPADSWEVNSPKNIKLADLEVGEWTESDDEPSHISQNSDDGDAAHRRLLPSAQRDLREMLTRKPCSLVKKAFPICHKPMKAKVTVSSKYGSLMQKALCDSIMDAPQGSIKFNRNDAKVGNTHNVSGSVQKTVKVSDARDLIQKIMKKQVLHKSDDCTNYSEQNKDSKKLRTSNSKHFDKPNCNVSSIQIKTLKQIKAEKQCRINFSSTSEKISCIRRLSENGHAFSEAACAQSEKKCFISKENIDLSSEEMNKTLECLKDPKYNIDNVQQIEKVSIENVKQCSKNFQEVPNMIGEHSSVIVDKAQSPKTDNSIIIDSLQTSQQTPNLESKKVMPRLPSENDEEDIDESLLLLGDDEFSEDDIINEDELLLS